MAVGWRDLGTSLAFNGGICVGLFFVFNYIRSSQLVLKFYAPKRYLKLPFRFRPKRLPNTIFTWIGPLISYTDHEILACAGMDALTYIRFLALGLKIAVTITVLAAIMIISTNYTGTFVDSELARQAKQRAEGQEVSGVLYTMLDKTSMSNIPDGSNKLWVHLVCTWLFSLIVMKMLWTAFEEAVKWRILYLSQTRRGDESHTILVQDIPGTLNGTIPSRIYDHMDVFPLSFLPKFVKTKVIQFVEAGSSLAGNGFGAVTNVANKLNKDASMDLFKDKDMTVYTEGARLMGDSANKDMSPLGSLTLVDASDFQDAVSFSSARSALSRSSLKGMSRSGSGIQPFQINDIQPESKENTQDEAAEALRTGLASDTLTVAPVSPRPTVPQRTNLRYFKPRRPATDFDTWEQAAAAIAQGMTVKELTFREFSRTVPHPSDIASVASVKHQKKLAPLVQKYEAAVLAVQDKCDQWTVLLRRRKPVKRNMQKIYPLVMGARAIEKFGSKPVKVDEMALLQWRLRDAYDAMKDEQAACETQETCAAFVTLNSRVMSSGLAQGLQSHNEAYWQTSVAPGPQEVIWDSISYRGWERSIRLLIAWGMFVTMCLFYFIPVAFIQQLLSLEKYEPDDPTGIIKFLTTAPVVAEVLKGILPTLALKIFLALVPLILRFMNSIQGVYSQSQMDFEVGRKYFLFQFLILFVFTIISGVLTQNLQAYFKDPGSLVNDLGSSVPKQGTFYTMYIITNGLFARPLQFLKIPGALIYLILSKLSATERAKKRKWALQYMRYGDDVPDHSICILLLLVFSCVQPLVAAVAVLYFCVNITIAKYQLLYVYRELFQSGGLYWPVVFDQIFVGLVVFQLSMLGILGVKKFPPGVFVFPLLVVTFLFRKAVAANFSRPIRGLSLHAAADLDRDDQRDHWTKNVTAAEEAEFVATFDCEDVRFGPSTDRYLSPCFKIDEAEVRQTLHEAEILTERVEAIASGRPVEHIEFNPQKVDDDDHEDESQTILPV